MRDIVRIKTKYQLSERRNKQYSKLYDSKETLNQCSQEITNLVNCLLLITADKISSQTTETVTLVVVNTPQCITWLLLTATIKYH